MSDSEQTSNASAAEMQSALFAQLIMQQANMAMMLLGKTPHPETGETVKDLDAARLFIDQLEMLEVKTKGNLTKDEAGLLKQTLMALRLAFVEAVENPAQPPKSPEKAPAQTTDAPPPPAEEHHKKFTKKY